MILSPSNLAFWILTAHCLGSVAGMILGVTSKVGRAPTQAVRVVVHWSLRCRQGGTGAGRAEARDFPFFLETHCFFCDNITRFLAVEPDRTFFFESLDIEKNNGWMFRAHRPWIGVFLHLNGIINTLSGIDMGFPCQLNGVRNAHYLKGCPWW